VFGTGALGTSLLLRTVICCDYFLDLCLCLFFVFKFGFRGDKYLSRLLLRLQLLCETSVLFAQLNNAAAHIIIMEVIIITKFIKAGDKMQLLKLFHNIVFAKACTSGVLVVVLVWKHQ